MTEPPPGPVDFVVDTFGRTVSSGWGSADTGGAWTTTGTLANFAVAGGTGAMTIPAAGSTRSVYLGATTRTDTDLRLTLSLDKVPTGSGAYLDVVGRRISTNNEYRARLVMAATGRITVQLDRAARHGLHRAAGPCCHPAGDHHLRRRDPAQRPHAGDRHQPDHACG